MLRRCLRRPATAVRHVTATPLRPGIGLRVRHASSNPPRLWHRFRLPPLDPDLVVRVSLWGIAASLSAHIFFEYFYILEGAYGISMLPTIASTGDWLLISKYYRRGRQLSVGDIVSYRHPIKPREYAVKRILGMPGDFVMTETPGKGVGRMIQVPEGHCWVVGENLTWSRDSRMFGPLPLALVTGKVLAKCSPPRLWFTKLDHELKPAVLDDHEVD